MEREAVSSTGGRICGIQAVNGNDPDALKMPNHISCYLRRDDAAAYVRQKHKTGCTAGYLAKLASVGGGPVFHRLHNRWAVYTEEDLDSWALSRISGPMRKASDLPPTRAA